MKFRFADKLVFGLLFLAAFLLALSLVLYHNGQALAFYLLSFTMIGSAIGVVLVREIIRSAFLLALSFVCMGGLYVTLSADFLAAAQILIYAGAVAILFVFAIMLTQRTPEGEPSYSSEFRFIAFIFISFGLLILMIRAIFQGRWKIDGTTTPENINTVVKIGEQFFSTYIIPFEIASIVLLMALIGAIVIAKKEPLSHDG